MRNLFRPLTPEEKAAKENRRHKAEKERKIAMVAARKCLNTKDFERYRQKLKKAHDSTMNQALELRIVDPVKYAFEMQRLMNNLRSLRTLQIEVEKEARV